jgi:hypothetical protein
MKRGIARSSAGNQADGAPSEAVKELSEDDDTVKKARHSQVVSRCGLPTFVLTETLACAYLRRCVACAHKIAFGIELPPEAKPNVRPELCPRARGALRKEGTALGLYPLGSKVLTVGDGDLSFSLSLIRALGAGNVVATTYESRESIIRSYPDTGLKNLQELERIGCAPTHGVDAMDLRSTLRAAEASFDFVVFNFPCIATEVEGEDAQNRAMLENQTLLRKFGVEAARLLKPSGQVHVSHKTKAAFKHWDVPGFIASESTLRSLCAVVFDRCAYPGYINRKARDRKSFPVTDAVVFVFGCAELPFAVEDHRGMFLEDEESLGSFIGRVQAEGTHLLPLSHALVDGIVRAVLLS